MVIVKSKITGKFLRQHSGSANAFSRKKHYQVMGDKKFTATLPPDPEGYNFYRDPTSERRKLINSEAHKRMYDADALEARRYASVGSALSSIGKWNGKSHFGRDKVKKSEPVHVLPEYLEIHEIVAGNLCLVNPDDDDETKRRKEKECK